MPRAERIKTKADFGESLVREIGTRNRGIEQALVEWG